jgi:hypothetical protein
MKFIHLKLNFKNYLNGFNLNLAFSMLNYYFFGFIYFINELNENLKFFSQNLRAKSNLFIFLNSFQL